MSPRQKPIPVHGNTCISLILLFILCLIPAQLLAIGQPTLLKDINPGPASGLSPTENFVVVGDVAYFAASDGVHGLELWRSDGTAGGTTLVKDINPGTGSSYPAELTVVGDRIFFSTYDPTATTKLWVSDGTAAGTQLVKDIHPAGASSQSRLTAVGDQLFFLATTPTTGTELWKSDGTEAGTVLVKDIIAEPTNSIYSFSVLVNAGGKLLFAVNNSSTWELWQSDGTASGTSMIRSLGQEPHSFTSCNGKIYFEFNDGVNGSELWVTDGTDVGTQLVKDLNAGANGSAPQSLTCSGTTLFFVANADDLWASDGTPDGTRLVDELAGGITGSGNGLLTPFAGNIFFVSGGKLWQGTTAGVVQLGPAQGVSLLAPIGSRLFFIASANTDFWPGTDLWQTDGTEDGTYLLANLITISATPSPSGFKQLGNRLLCSIEGFVEGRELWSFALTPAPVSRITSPAGNAYLSNAPITVAGTAGADTGSPISLVEVSADNGGTWSAATGTSRWSYALTLPDGVYQLLSRATDLAGNVEVPSSPVRITVDRTPPAGTVVINGDAALTFSPRVTLAVTADATEFGYVCQGTNPNICGPVTWLVSNDGITWTNFGASTAITWTLSDGDGLKTVYLKLTDRSGNQLLTSDTINLDTTLSPKTTITSPTPGSATNQQSLTIRGTASAGAGATIVKVEMRFNNSTAWQPVSGTDTWSYVWANAPEGSYTVQARTTDSLGRVEIPLSNVYATIDRTPPTGFIVYVGGQYRLDAQDSWVFCPAQFPNVCGVTDMSLDNGLTWVSPLTPIMFLQPALIRDLAGNVGIVAGSSVMVERFSLPVYFSTLPAAFANATAGDIFKFTTSPQVATIAISQNLMLRGGFDSLFTSQVGVTPVAGTVTINDGNVVMENIQLTGVVTVDGGLLEPANFTIM